MSLINKEIGEFTVQAYHEGAFKAVSKADVLGKWAVFFFYPADFTFVCPTELKDLAISMWISRQPDARCIPYPVTPIMSIKHGMTRLTGSKRSVIRCWRIPHMCFPGILRYISRRTA